VESKKELKNNKLRILVDNYFLVFSFKKKGLPKKRTAQKKGLKIKPKIRLHNVPLALSTRLLTLDKK